MSATGQFLLSLDSVGHTKGTTGLRVNLPDGLRPLTVQDRGWDCADNSRGGRINCSLDRRISASSPARAITVRVHASRSYRAQTPADRTTRTTV